MNATKPIRAAMLTPPGRGAVATIVVWGDDAVASVERWFHPASGKSLGQEPVRRIVFGRWGSPPGEQVVVVRTDDTTVEIHGHGGVAAPMAILSDLRAIGIEIVSGHEFQATRISDPIQRAAAEQLAQAPTLRTARILLDQYHGALRRELDEIERLRASGDLQAARERCERLLARAEIGAHLTKPWRVVIAGPPNVGKSSLINALLGYERAIVFNQPGTTRDVVAALTSFDGWPIELADTAGLRTSDDPLESAGIALAEQELSQADLIVLVLDITQNRTEADARLCEQYPDALRVFSKCDQVTQQPALEQGLATSAVTGSGLPELMHAIVARLVPHPPQPGDAVPFTTPIVDQVRAMHSQKSDRGRFNTECTENTEKALRKTES
ncbi:MAG: 50S ribosome-binding GTPase [Planctomycetaceae bacterium]|nr:50S ribosome-binding GTPase [Planctomycetaceae bacterium]